MSDRALGLVSVLMAGCMAFTAWSYAAPVEYEPVGPRAFPLLLALGMAICGAWLLLRPGIPVSWPRGIELRHIGICTAAIVLYAIFFQVLGFILATALMTLPVGRVFGGSWRQCLIAGLLMGGMLYLLFDRLLDVVLPLGLIA